MSGETLLSVPPQVSIPVIVVAVIIRARGYVLYLWGKLEDLISGLRKLLDNLSGKVQDALKALLSTFNAEYEQDHWCATLKVDNPRTMDDLVNTAKTRLKTLECQWLVVKERWFPVWAIKAYPLHRRLTRFQAECNKLNGRVTGATTRIEQSIYKIPDPDIERTIKGIETLNDRAREEREKPKGQRKERKRKPRVPARPARDGLSLAQQFQQAWICAANAELEHAHPELD
ncbi:hypothetical protein PsYK624_087080 [Phanerochaete sordida]|uniref:Uncharacterized protein n=1 Tax=Phanerochaete sordida TaxID=48140 RepID=A0A9P3GAN9_9APHY|nr:hypothetical protein PsYK624_087080 [Phanerochaete sordida]